jgi:hypothetical protein
VSCLALCQTIPHSFITGPYWDPITFVDEAPPVVPVVPVVGGAVVGGAVVGGAVVGGAVVGGGAVGGGVGFVLLTGPGFFVVLAEGRIVPLLAPTRLGAVGTIPAGTRICVGLAVADAPLLPEAAGDVAPGLAGDISLVGLIG